MPTDPLWAPWRLPYVCDAAGRDGNACFICHAAAAPDAAAARDRLVVWRGRCWIAILNRFPYNNGHTLLAPVAHKGGLEDLDGEEAAEQHAAILAVKRGLDRVLSPHAYNVGLNLGREAGAGLPGHLHWHIVPRWAGDTNFMSVASDTRVIIQSLQALQDALDPILRHGVAGS